jgi:hypothetical protein
MREKIDDISYIHISNIKEQIMIKVGAYCNTPLHARRKDK